MGRISDTSETAEGDMDEAVRIIKAYFGKKHKVTPGIIAGLHTFGSRLNFNPHVHMLVGMGGMKANGEWKTYDYIPFEMLRKQWQTVVLKLIRKRKSKRDYRRPTWITEKASMCMRPNNAETSRSNWATSVDRCVVRR